MNSLRQELALPLYEVIRGQCKFWNPDSRVITNETAGLWLGVIWQAIDDLCLLHSINQERRNAAEDAVDFLITSAPSRLTPITEHLGLSQPWVTERIRRAMNGGAA